jgi:hypothetical protein
LKFARGAGVLVILAGMVLGCPGAPPSPPTAVIVGVTTDLSPGTDFSELDVDMLLNGASIGQKKIPATPGAFPLEIPFKSLKGGDAVEVDLKAMSNGVAIVDRRQRTDAIAGETLLFRVPLDRNCVAPVGPTCPTEETCAAGQCINVLVDSRILPMYSSSWGTTPSDDPCKPPDQAPIVDVGEGQADYLPVNDGDVLQVEAGPQGGYHVWLALRMKGLHQSSSITTVTGQIPDLGYDVAPFSVVFSFSPTDGGYCKIYGLRFRLDDPTHPVAMLLGHPLDITITVKDTDGSIGTGQKHVVLSTNFQ